MCYGIKNVPKCREVPLEVHCPTHEERQISSIILHESSSLFEPIKRWESKMVRKYGPVRVGSESFRIITAIHIGSSFW